MYGLTSDPQLLQTTKRSCPPVLTLRWYNRLDLA
jgi:hypothetical protein